MSQHLKSEVIPQVLDLTAVAEYLTGSILTGPNLVPQLLYNLVTRPLPPSPNPCVERRRQNLTHSTAMQIHCCVPAYKDGRCMQQGVRNMSIPMNNV